MIKVYSIAGAGLIIGEFVAYVDHPSADILTNPRVIQTTPESVEGMLNVMFAVLIGDPAELKLNVDKVLFEYEPDESLQASYKAAISSLTLARELPANLRQFPPNGGRG